MSPSRLPAPSDPDAPKYWRDETTGRLAAAVHAYFDNPDALTMRELGILRAYFSQWIQSPAWDLNPAHDDASRAELAALRAGVGAITNARDVAAWLRAAETACLDPL
jgi:hypothetical protein